MAKCKRVGRDGTIIRRFFSGRRCTHPTSDSTLDPPFNSIQHAGSSSNDKEPLPKLDIDWDSVTNSPALMYRNNAELLNLGVASCFLESAMLGASDKDFMGRFTCNRWRQASEIGVFKRDAVSLEKTIEFSSRFATRRDELRGFINNSNHHKKVQEPTSQPQVISDFERTRGAAWGTRVGSKSRVENGSGLNPGPSPLWEVQTFTASEEEDSFALPPIKRHSILFGALCADSTTFMEQNDAAENGEEDPGYVEEDSLDDDEKDTEDEDGREDEEDPHEEFFSLARRAESGSLPITMEKCKKESKKECKRSQFCPCDKHYGSGQLEEERKYYDQAHALARTLRRRLRHY